jgi:hypothetical protein
MSTFDNRRTIICKSQSAMESTITAKPVPLFGEAMEHVLSIFGFVHKSNTMVIFFNLEFYVKKMQSGQALRCHSKKSNGQLLCFCLTIDGI